MPMNTHPPMYFVKDGKFVLTNFPESPEPYIGDEFKPKKGKKRKTKGG